MAEVLFDNDGLRIWTDGSSPIMFVKFSSPRLMRVGVDKSIRKGQAALGSVLAKSENVYSIIDISDCNDHCALTLLTFCFSHFPQLQDDAIKYLALVPAVKHAPVLENNLSDLLGPYLELRKGVFKDFFSALGKINSIRQQQASLTL